ncbi:MAG: DUF4347 domain-containing protein [Leptolyngbyaceae cyanobacterium]
MSIYVKETTLSQLPLMPFNIQPKDPILATCQTLIFVNPLVLVESYGGDRSIPLSDTGIVQMSLPPFGHGVSKIAHILGQCPQIQSLHIYTTGSPGRLDLGQDTLTNETIEHYAWELQSWFSGLPSYVTPSLTLGHCNVGDGMKGITLIDQLRILTGCHIRCLCSETGRHLQLV